MNANWGMRSFLGEPKIRISALDSTVEDHTRISSELMVFFYHSTVNLVRYAYPINILWCCRQHRRCPCENQMWKCRPQRRQDLVNGRRLRQSRFRRFASLWKLGKSRASKDHLISWKVFKFMSYSHCSFLVSFLVDARGGFVEAQRRPDLRFMIPPHAISSPTRIICRLLRPDRVSRLPHLNDGDAFACR